MAEMSDEQQHTAETVYPFASVASHVGAFLLVYDPYHPDEVRNQIAQFDATRLVDAPRAQVVVLIPTMKQHIESGNRIDFDILRHGVDVVGVYDSDSARRAGKALAGSGVRVVVMPPPRIRDIRHPEEVDERKALPGKAAALQMLYNITAAEARELAGQIGAPLPESTPQRRPSPRQDQ